MGKKELLLNSLANRGGVTVEDVFSTYLYEGTGFSQKIVNGINLAGEPVAAIDTKMLESFGIDLYTGNNVFGHHIENGVDLEADGGAVFIKSRSNTEAFNVYDTDRGAARFLRTNSTGIDVAGVCEPFD